MKYVCLLCGYVYDDAKEAVPFADLPDSWTCPLCGSPKSLFQAMEDDAAGEGPVASDGGPSDAAAQRDVQVERTERADAERVEQVDGECAEQGEAAESADPAHGLEFAIDVDGDALVRLSAGQLAALSGNLARGCEKQSRAQEAELFRKLAAYFTEQVEPEQDASIDALSALLLADADDRYPAAKRIATQRGDRGALRVLTWGERITRMLSYLIGRYLEEGEAFLADTEIWVCTVCGFIFVGKEAPELCPVCKVPAWKFQKMERRTA